MNITEEDVRICVHSTQGDDGNPGTDELPVKTLKAAFALRPEAWKKKCEIVNIGPPIDLTTDPFGLCVTADFNTRLK